MSIYESILAVMADISPIAKDRKNEQQRFFYRSIDQIMNVLQPALKKNGLVVLPEVLEETREQITTAKGTVFISVRVRVKYVFANSKGEHLSTTVSGEAMDTGDKATSKALTMAYKTVLSQVFCIPTDDPDPDSQSIEQTETPEDIAKKACKEIVARLKLTEEEIKRQWKVAGRSYVNFEKILVRLEKQKGAESERTLL